MAERILYKNSCNLAALIQLMTIHEESTSRHLRQQSRNETNVVNLLNNVLNSSRVEVAIDASNIVQLIHDDNSLNLDYLEEMKYRDLDSPIYTICPISHEVFQEETDIIQIKTCKHYFKKSSIIPWLRQNSKCPYCRSHIVFDD